MQKKLKGNGPGVQKISFHCAKDGTAFSVLFARNSSEDKFRIRSIDSPHGNTHPRHKQTFLEGTEVRGGSNPAGESKSFDAKDFDMAGWQCACCRHSSSWPAFVKCTKCNRLVCGSKVISIQNGPKTFQCAPDCEGGGVIEGEISNYNVEIERTKTDDPRPTPNSEMVLPARGTSEHVSNAPLTANQRVLAGIRRAM